MPSIRSNLDNYRRCTIPFLKLVKAGLWERDIDLSIQEEAQITNLILLSEEQAIVGLIAAGIDHLRNTQIKKDVILSCVGKTLQLEQNNRNMNDYLAKLQVMLSNKGINAILLKGQGVAQCYEKPLWRACGDIDLLLDGPNYFQAKSLLIPLATEIDIEYPEDLHLGISIDGWRVELHGSLRGLLLKRIDRTLDSIQKDVFSKNQFRLWDNGKIGIKLLSPDDDVFYVFSHILEHFFYGGVGLRQICDWCRLLWVYKDSLNHSLLKSRLRGSGIMTEWKAFASLAVVYLGMPVAAIPFYSSDFKWTQKGKRVMALIMEAGNFGQNRDISYFKKYPYLVRKTISLWRHSSDCLKRLLIFPKDTVLIWGRIISNGVVNTLKGK